MRHKKAVHAAGHGGWFVTFADLMALLMSFFVMLTAMSTQDQKKMQMVAGSMRDAFGSQKELRRSGIIEADGIPVRSILKNVRKAPPDDGSDYTTPTPFEPVPEGISSYARQDRAFALAAVSLRQALQDMPEIAELSKNIVFEDTKDGLSISIVDQDGKAMFPEGSRELNERARRIVERLAPPLHRMPNRITVTGHTAAARDGRTSAGNWDLSTGRAGAVRELLAANGVPDDRFAAIVGKADTEPMFPDNPYLATNRRVTILLLNEAPPLPTGLFRPSITKP